MHPILKNILKKLTPIFLLINDLVFLPKTSKGKEKKLTATSVLDYGGIGNQFSFAMYHYNTGNEAVMKWRVNGQEMGFGT